MRNTRLLRFVAVVTMLVAVLSMRVPGGRLSASVKACGCSITLDAYTIANNSLLLHYTEGAGPFTTSDVVDCASVICQGLVDARGDYVCSGWSEPAYIVRDWNWLYDEEWDGYY